MPRPVTPEAFVPGALAIGCDRRRAIVDGEEVTPTAIGRRLPRVFKRNRRACG